MKLTFFTAFLFMCISSFAQDFSVESLIEKGDEELLRLFSEVSEDSVMAERVARVYLRRAKREKDTIKMARGYDRLARIFHPKKNIMFGDSIIELTQNLTHKTYPALGYMIKFYHFNAQGKLKPAVENAIIGYDFALLNENIQQQLYFSNYLIYEKSTWGNKEEALELQLQHDEQINSNNFSNMVRQSTRVGVLSHIDDLILEAKLSSLQNYVFCYINLRQLDLASYYLDRGFNESKKYRGYTSRKEYYSEWFLEISVEVYFHSGQYLRSLASIDELFIKRKKEFNSNSLLNIYLFKGLSYIGLNDYDNGIKNLLISDSIFNKENISLLPDQRVLFENLLDYYTRKKETIRQIEYLNKLLYVDSVFKMNYQFFEPGLIKNYETPRLLNEKEALINELKIKNDKSKGFLWIGFIALLLSFIIIRYLFKRQLLFKRRFENLIRENSKNKNSKASSSNTDIPTKIIDEIMSCLAKFEKEKGFLTKNASLSQLASSFKTNPRYLSKVINFQKDKHFPTYINDLRVEFALKELAENVRFRKYTIKAIASDCGFKSAESFSQSFYKRHGIFPSYYIKRLEKIKK